MQPSDFIFDNPGWRKRHFLQDSCKKCIALKDSSKKLISWKILVSILKEMHCLEGSWKKSIDLQDSCKKSIFLANLARFSQDMYSFSTKSGIRTFPCFSWKVCHWIERWVSVQVVKPIDINCFFFWKKSKDCVTVGPFLLNQYRLKRRDPSKNIFLDSILTSNAFFFLFSSLFHLPAFLLSFASSPQFSPHICFQRFYFITFETTTLIFSPCGTILTFFYLSHLSN